MNLVGADEFIGNVRSGTTRVDGALLVKESRIFSANKTSTEVGVTRHLRPYVLIAI
jgi:hypothetical protein